MAQNEIEKNIGALEKRVTEVIRQYIDHEDDYTDDVQLEIDTTDYSVALADPEQDLPQCDYYPMMDLIRMSSTTPGKWEPDPDAISSLLSDYLT